MKKSLPWILLALAGTGFPGAPLILAQQSAGKGPQSNDSTSKSCITVSGAVRFPARIETHKAFRLLELLAISGGVTEKADGTIQIIQSGWKCSKGGAAKQTEESDKARGIIVLKLPDLLRGDEKGNPFLMDGELIVVTELAPIFITGNVVNEREIYSKERLTLTQAVKMAGGVRPNTKTGRIVIYRQKKDSVGNVVIEANFEAINSGQADDPTLQPYDIIEVRPSGPRKVGPPLSYPSFDSRPLIPLDYRVIY
jgi:hypothetical protein